MALSNTAATLPGIFMPSLTNAVATSTNVDTLQHQWRIVFLASAIVSIAVAVFYGCYAQATPIDFDHVSSKQRRDENSLHQPFIEERTP